MSKKTPAGTAAPEIKPAYELLPAIPTFTVIPSCGGSVTLPAPADASNSASDQESEHAEK